jgi:hypothetical protein
VMLEGGGMTHKIKTKIHSQPVLDEYCGYLTNSVLASFDRHSPETGRGEGRGGRMAVAAFDSKVICNTVWGRERE